MLLSGQILRRYCVMGTVCEGGGGGGGGGGEEWEECFGCIYALQIYNRPTNSHMAAALHSINIS